VYAANNNAPLSQGHCFVVRVKLDVSY